MQVLTLFAREANRLLVAADPSIGRGEDSMRVLNLVHLGSVLGQSIRSRTLL